MSESSLSIAFEKFANALGSQNVITCGDSLQSAAQNTAALNRQICGILKPASVADVQELVRIANHCRVALYPFSGGRNWGYGSRLPIRDASVLVDLSRMRRIRNSIDAATHMAEIEPGVTQRQLWQHLQDYSLPLMFNVTGAGGETSVLGNALDRGCGYLAMKPEDIHGLEVVLGTGELLRTGFGHYAGCKTAGLYKYGLGPSLDGLFFQSNFGIVTAASVHLHPRREAHGALMIKAHAATRLKDMIDALAGLRRQAVFEAVLHVGNKLRIEATLAPLISQVLLAEGKATAAHARAMAEAMLQEQQFASWSAVGSLFGSRDEVAAKVGEITNCLREIASVDFLPMPRPDVADGRAATSVLAQAMHASLQALMDLCDGKPTDAALLSPRWSLADESGLEVNLDHTNVGLIYCCPVLPLVGREVSRALQIAEQITTQHGFKPYATVNLINTKSALCILNILFAKNDGDQVQRAHRCVEALQQAWVAEGYFPYRIGIQAMGSGSDSPDTYWRIVQQLKNVFDPNHIIAPGRYDADPLFRP